MVPPDIYNNIFWTCMHSTVLKKIVTSAQIKQVYVYSYLIICVKICTYICDI